MKTRTLCLLLCFCCIFFVQKVFAENLSLNDIQNAQQGSTVDFSLTINNAPNEVGAFGFKISYNPDILSYQSFELAAAYKDRFDLFNGNMTEKGKIVFGGVMSSQKIAPGESGVLLTLSFTVVKSENDILSLDSLKDHFKGWSVKNGLFNQDSVGFEDIDSDGKVGLADVIHLLQIVSGFNVGIR